ncbi:MAG: tetratricopeptide repeat protein, partial [Terriglobales bacterium]
WLFNNGAQEKGLALAKEFSGHMGSDTLVRILEPVLTRERENIGSLETLLAIYLEIGSKAHVLECTDLLADALVRSGNFERARDLYAELAKLEPDNPVHEQRHRQMLMKLGQPTPADAPPKPFIPEEEAARAAEEAKQVPFSAAVPAPAEMDVSSEWETAFEAPAAGGASPAQEIVEEVKFYIAQGMWSEAAAGVARCESADPRHPELAGLKAQVAAAQQSASSEFAVEVQPPAAEAAVTPEAAPPPPDFSFEVTPPVAEISVEVPPPAAPVEAVAAAPADQFGDFLSDLDSALPQDFHAPPAAQAKAAAASAAPVARAAAPPVAPPAPVVPPPVAASSAAKSEEESLLDDMFQEFKEEAEQGAGEAEDPETHYNLGVAFREMGLMDEAIGELQKVCNAIEKGATFRDSIQAFTWLAQCFVDKGVPEASYKWYEKALKLSDGEEQRLALHYDLAGAYELAGNKQSALQHFMEVYGSNIDYRDVAERIKALRA